MLFALHCNFLQNRLTEAVPQRAIIPDPIDAPEIASMSSLQFHQIFLREMWLPSKRGTYSRGVISSLAATCVGYVMAFLPSGMGIAERQREFLELANMPVKYHRDF